MILRIYIVYEWFTKQAGITHVTYMSHAPHKFEQSLDFDAEKAGSVMKKNKSFKLFSMKFVGLTYTNKVHKYKL